MSDNSDNIYRITGLETPSAPKSGARAGSEWADVLKSYNLFGIIGAAYARTLDYKLESKRLDIEFQRVREQASLLRDGLDRSFELKMEELRNRQTELVSIYATVKSELQQLHLERTTILKMAKCSQEQALTPGRDAEYSKILMDHALECIKMLPQFGDRANQQVTNLLNVLPPVEIPKSLMQG